MDIVKRTEVLFQSIQSQIQFFTTIDLLICAAIGSIVLLIVGHWGRLKRDWRKLMAIILLSGALFLVGFSLYVSASSMHDLNVAVAQHKEWGFLIGTINTFFSYKLLWDGLSIAAIVIGCAFALWSMKER